VLAISLPALQAVRGGKQATTGVDPVYLPLVLNGAPATLTPTPTSSPTRISSPTPSPTGTFTPTPSPTITPSLTASPSPSQTTTLTSTSTPAKLPTLTLSVAQSPLAVYPPIMIYTAQLSYVPTTSTAQMKVDTYNLKGTGLEYLGSAPVDKTGKAVLSRQMYPGTFTAIARVVIDSKEVWSNSVRYEVR
jgi:hypothetical protein